MGPGLSTSRAEGWWGEWIVVAISARWGQDFQGEGLRVGRCVGVVGIRARWGQEFPDQGLRAGRLRRLS